MGEPRQRVAYPEIIDDKKLKTKKRIFFETSLTLGFWGVMLYFITIFVTFILWLAGFKLFYYEIYAVGYEEMLRLFTNGGSLTLIIVAGLMAWSYYNIALIKIKGERRKREVRICFDQDLAELINVDFEMLEKNKNNPCIHLFIEGDTILFDEPHSSTSKQD